jgi:hypothetical protein
MLVIFLGQGVVKYHLHKLSRGSNLLEDYFYLLLSDIFRVLQLDFLTGLFRKDIR